MPLLLTGGPAAGKSTTARELARTVARSAVVDVDDVRQLVVAGHAAPWEGEEGLRQQRLGVENACGLARRLWAAGFDVVLSDVVDAGTLEQYRSLLPDVLVVRLRLPLDVARRRAAMRPAFLRADEFEALHAREAALVLPVDHTVEVADLMVAQQCRAVRRLWDASGESPA